MVYKLVIENTVEVPVKFTLNNAGKDASFSFSLLCHRLPQEEIRETILNTKELVADFLKRVIKGWIGQALVVDEGGNPADFNPASLQAMLSVAGLPSVFYKRYLEECGAKEKN